VCELTEYVEFYISFYSRDVVYVSTNVNGRDINGSEFESYLIF